MLDFQIVDVFAEERFAGNQLAVVLDAASLSEQTMQRIAAEFNFSETTFVLPPVDPPTLTRPRDTPTPTLTLLVFACWSLAVSDHPTTASKVTSNAPRRPSPRSGRCRPPPRETETAEPY